MHSSSFDYISLAAYVFVGLLILAFILLAFRDVGRLRTGLSRAWGVARVTLSELWFGRAWAIPLIWLAVCLVIGPLIRPYSVSSRVAVDLMVLLRSQTLLVLVYLGVMACMALPRERQRRTIITTGSKPITRLELLLGKIMGLSAAGFMLLLVMGAASWAIMNVEDLQIRHEAVVLYSMEKKQYDQAIRHIPPQKGILYTAQHGAIEAQNYFTGTMRIAGLIDYSTTPPTRFLKGGNNETLYFEFPSLPALPGHQPAFVFYFHTIQAYPNNGLPRLHVTLEQRYNTRVTEEKSLTLSPQGAAIWFPKNPENFFAYEDPQTGQIFDPGPVVIKLTSPNLGDYLQILPGTSNQNTSCLAINLDPSRAKGGYMLPKPDPVITGFMADGKDEIVGPSVRHPRLRREVASFEFNHLPINQIPLNDKGEFIVHLLLGVEKQVNEALPAEALIRAYNVDNPHDVVNRVLRINEKHVSIMHLPSRLLTGGSLVIDVRSKNPGHWIKLTQDSVQIVQPSSPFIVNLAKSELVIFCEVVLLVVIGVVSGTRLGWPVAMLTTLTCYILGNLFHFVTQLAQSGGLEITSYYTDMRLKGVWYYEIGSFLTAMLVRVLNMLVHLMPDFRRFDPLTFIKISRNMPWQILVADIGWTLACVLPAIAIGYLLLRKQELA